MPDVDAQDLFEWVTVPLNSLLELCAAQTDGPQRLADDRNRHRMLEDIARHIDAHREPGLSRPEPAIPARHIQPRAPSCVSEAARAPALVQAVSSAAQQDFCLPQRAYGAPHPSGSNAYAPRSLSIPDLHRAQRGNLVLAATSGYAAYSTDGGNTLKPLDPDRIFPQGPEGTSCREQTAAFLPQINRFAWIMRLINAMGSRHFVRVAAASPQEIICTKCTGWTYWDLAVSPAGAGGNMLCVDAAEQGDQLRVGMSTRHGERQEIHLPLAEIVAGAPIRVPVSMPSRRGHVQTAGSHWAIAHRVMEQP